jgi:very-short-patch-repair endonuclease
MRCGKRPTPAEKALRTALGDACAHAKSTGGKRFRFQFQAICAGYILDLYCASIRVAVEVDGSSHDGREKRDESRDAICRIGLRFNPAIYQ